MSSSDCDDRSEGIDVRVRIDERDVGQRRSQVGDQ